MMNNNLIGIIGAGKSGTACCELALRFGYKVILSEISKNKDINIKKHPNLIIEKGSHSDKLLECSMLIISPGISSDIDIVRRAQKRDVPIVGEIEFASWFTKSEILAITGSNGKSTACMMLHNMLLESGINSLLGGNIGTAFSENLVKEIDQDLKNCVHVLELSSFQIETLAKFHSKIACILNISEDHLDRYKDMNAYIAAKLKIAEFTNKLVYDLSDPILNERLKNISNTEKINHEKSKYKILNDSIYNDDGLMFSLTETNFIGRHNLLNALNAATIASLYGVSDQDIVNSIKKIKPLPHRLELVKSIGSMKFYNDSKSTNIESTIKALESFTKDVVLILGGLNKGSDFSDLISSLNPVNKIYCYGESGEEILNKLDVGVRAKYFNNFSKCVNESIQNASSNECVLLSPGCASFDQFRNFEERGDVFKKIVLRYNDVQV